MDELEILNNKKLFLEITRMRDTVQRAKVSASRKILRKVNELECKKGNKKEKTRNTQKVERLMNEIKEIKKIRADDVTKFALVNSMENYLEFIKDEETAAHIKGMARIACEKALTSKLTQIKQKYENWNDVQAVLKTTKRVRKKLKKKEKVNDQNKISDTETPIILEFKSSDDEYSSGPDEPPVDDFEDNSDSDLEQTIEIDVQQNSESDLDQTSESDIEQILEGEVSELNSQDTVKNTAKPQKEQAKDVKGKVLNKKSKSKIVAVLKANEVEISELKEPTKSSSTAVVRRLANLEELETMGQGATNTPTVISDNLKKSSFFLSADGEEVESDVDDAISSSESETFENDEAATPGFNKVYHSRGRDKAQSTGQRQPQRLGALNNRDQQNSKKWNNGPAKKGNQPSRPQHSAFPNTHTNQGSSVPVKPEEPKKLHPSWEAKKKLREAIQIDFKPSNKKIKFD